MSYAHFSGRSRPSSSLRSSHLLYPPYYRKQYVCASCWVDNASPVQRIRRPNFHVRHLKPDSAKKRYVCTAFFSRPQCYCQGIQGRYCGTRYLHTASGLVWSANRRQLPETQQSPYWSRVAWGVCMVAASLHMWRNLESALCQASGRALLYMSFAVWAMGTRLTGLSSV